MSPFSSKRIMLKKLHIFIKKNSLIHNKPAVEGAARVPLGRPGARGLRADRRGPLLLLTLAPPPQEVVELPVTSILLVQCNLKI